MRAEVPRPVSRLAHPATLAALASLMACPAPSHHESTAGYAMEPMTLEGLSLLPRAAVEGAPARTASFGPAADRPFLGGLAANRSYSIGTTRDGYLIGGLPLTAAEGIAPRPISVQRDAIYGTDALVAALGRAGRAVARRWPGSTLWAGDLSGPRGGDLPGHQSHNSGRDADLAFYMRDPRGALDDSPRLARVGANLQAGARHFDVARNWALVEALLRDSLVQVQWLFVADHLRAALLEHGEAAGADPEVLRRARAVLRQPRDSSPHAEHFHLRIYCGLDERLEGCLDAAPFHPWIRRFEAEVDALAAGLLPFLELPWSEELEFAVTRLVRINAVSATPALAARVDDDDPRVATLAADALAFLTGRRTPERWRQWRAEDVGD